MWAPCRASLTWALLALCAVGCAAAPTPGATPAASLPAAAPTASQTANPTPLPQTPTPAPSPSATAAPAACSPLQGIPLGEIPAAVTNPYHPPRPGFDDPHAGVDLSDRAPGSQVALSGRTVEAALAGRVAAVIRDRFPFGNALLIETPLQDLPAGFLEQLAIPAPVPPQGNRSALTCPAGASAAEGDPGRRSLYLLYAHLLKPPDVLPGDGVTCGQALGQIGSSGNALNPHLHLEARTGPAGVQFSSLAHYDASASEEEMGNYCAWTVSGQFQLLDPLGIVH